MNIRAPLAFVAALLLVACATPQAQPTWDGLNLYPQKKVDAVYMKPGASFSGYTEIMIDPLVVSFDKNWDPRADRASLRVADTDGIKEYLAQTFREIFAETLAADGHFRVVDQAGPQTLRIVPAIADLYINAPDTSMQTAGRVTTYAFDPGRMTLVAEVRDAATGTPLVRIVDKVQGIDSGFLQVTNSVTNASDARRAIQRWANLFRDGLENVRTMPPAPTGG